MTPLRHRKNRQACSFNNMMSFLVSEEPSERDTSALGCPLSSLIILNSGVSRQSLMKLFNKLTSGVHLFLWKHKESEKRLDISFIRAVAFQSSGKAKSSQQRRRSSIMPDCGIGVNQQEHCLKQFCVKVKTALTKEISHRSALSTKL